MEYKFSRTNFFIKNPCYYLNRPGVYQSLNADLKWKTIFKRLESIGKFKLENGEIYIYNKNKDIDEYYSPAIKNVFFEKLEKSRLINAGYFPDDIFIKYIKFSKCLHDYLKDYELEEIDGNKRFTFESLCIDRYHIKIEYKTHKIAISFVLEEDGIFGCFGSKSIHQELVAIKGGIPVSYDVIEIAHQKFLTFFNSLYL